MTHQLHHATHKLLGLCLLVLLSVSARADYFTYNLGAGDVTLLDTDGYNFAWDTSINDSILTIDIVGTEEWEVKIKSPDSGIAVDQGIGFHDNDGWEIQVKQTEPDYELYLGDNTFTITSLVLADESIFVSYYFVDDSAAAGDEITGALCVGSNCVAPTAVPLPAAGWLFVSAVSLLFGSRRLRA